MKLKILNYLLIFLLYLACATPEKGILGVVYHASPKSRLTELTPSTSTHGKKFVYGSKDLGIVAAYLGK